MSTNAALSFYPLVFVPDFPDVIVGRKDTNSYASFPEDGVELLKQLQSGKSPTDASAWYEEQYHEPIDISNFLSTLSDLEFICTEHEAEIPAKTEQNSSVWTLVGRAFFSPIAWIIYASIMSYCLFLLFRFPYLRPTYRQLFFSQSLLLFELGITLGQLPGIFFHELFHVLAGKRLGISSRLGIGRRLYIMVFETHLDGLWSVPREQRYLPFLAGMLADILWFCLLTIAASRLYTPNNQHDFTGALLLSLAFSTLLRFVWQFYFYLQTDIYYVFTNFFRCVDLHKTTQEYLWNAICRVFGWKEKMHDASQWHPQDRRIAGWYVYFFCIGYVFSIATLAFVFVPASIGVLLLLVNHLTVHRTMDASFWDACVFIFINGTQFVVVCCILLRDLVAARKARQSRIAVEQFEA